MKEKRLNSEEAVDLMRLLIQSKIPLTKWGIRASKNFRSLLEEIQRGEAVLTLKAGNKLYRKIRVLLIDIFYQFPDSTRLLHLVERKQVLEDGRERIRKGTCSISEKLLVTEVATHTAIYRALTEELDIVGEVEFHQTDYYITQAHSKSYPGIETTSENFRFKVFLNFEQFNPAGYITREENLTTFFVWQEYQITDEQITIK